MGTYISITATMGLMPELPQTITVSDYTSTAALVGVHIDRAEAVVNSYCSGRYDVPFVAGSVPPTIKTLSEDITCYYVMRSLYSGSRDMVDYMNSYRSAIDQLKLIQKGEINLVAIGGGLVTETTIESNDGLISNTKSFRPIFNLDDDTSWQVDSDRIAADL